MSIAHKILRKISHYFSGLRDGWYLRRFLRLEKAAHRQLEIGQDVRFSVPVRGEGEGTLILGDRTIFGYRPAPRMGSGEILLQARTKDSRITIGKRSAISNNVSIISNGAIAIGDDCRIGDQVVIYDCDFHEINPQTRGRSVGTIKPVSIGNNVWLGSRVMVLKGVVIGDNSIVAAMSLVSKSIPANCIAGGIPARIIRTLE